MPRDLEPDYIEQTELTEKQFAYVTHFMTNGFNKKDAFYAAGFKCSPERLHARTSKLHNHPLIQAEIAKRQAANMTELNRYTPLDVMSRNLDYWFNKALDKSLDEGDRNRARAEAQSIAVQAAPYVHPKLQAIAIKTMAEKDINDYSDDELEITIARIEQALQTQPSPGIGEAGARKKAH